MLDGFLVRGKQAGFLPGFLCHPLRFSLALARLLQDCVQTYYKDILQRRITKTYYLKKMTKIHTTKTYYKDGADNLSCSFFALLLELSMVRPAVNTFLIHGQST